MPDELPPGRSINQPTYRILQNTHAERAICARCRLRLALFFVPLAVLVRPPDGVIQQRVSTGGSAC